MVLGETQVSPLLEERGLNLGHLYGDCYPLDHTDSWDKVIGSVIKLFLIIIILLFKTLSSYLPAVFLAPRRERSGERERWWGEKTRWTLRRSSGQMLTVTKLGL